MLSLALREGFRCLFHMIRQPMPLSRATARILGIWISPGHDFFGRYGLERNDYGALACQEIECVAGRGLRGDRFFDYKEDYKGQLTLLASEVINDVYNILQAPQTDPSAFRRNLLTEGLDLNALIGQRFRLGAVELSGSEECKPCTWMDTAVGDGTYESLKGRGGLRCRILRTGFLKTGPVEFEPLGPVDAEVTS